MSLEEFKSIFWWEWGHRFLGRFIGLAFFVPFVIFLFQKRVTRSLAAPLGVLFVLGGFQGFIGWWMVSSGLSQRIDVSQYRLAIHLGAACLLFAALIWVARSITPRPAPGPVSAGWRWAVFLFGAALYLQLIAGAFVAGLDAGYGYNTWPLIEGAFLPGNLFSLEPAWRNVFENTLTVQFNHRMIAYCIAIFAAILVWRQARSAEGFSGVHGWLGVLAGLVALQIALGIFTLLLVVPIPLAIAHQALAFVLIGATGAYLADMRQKR